MCVKRKECYDNSLESGGYSRVETEGIREIGAVEALTYVPTQEYNWCSDTTSYLVVAREQVTLITYVGGITGIRQAWHKTALSNSSFIGESYGVFWQDCLPTLEMEATWKSRTRNKRCCLLNNKVFSSGIWWARRPLVPNDGYSRF